MKVTAFSGDVFRLWLGRAAAGATDILLPPRCPGCGVVVERAGTLCLPCWEKLDFITCPQCVSCGRPFDYDPGFEAQCGVCLRRSPPFRRARAVLRYNESSRALILSFKHGDRCDLAPTFAAWMTRAGKGLLADEMILMPVPLHRRRLFQRRFNQSALLAGAIARQTGMEVALDGVLRIRNTPPQGHLRAGQRYRNVRGAFQVAPSWRGKVKGRQVLLVDDVFTTGATLAACALSLLAAGAAAVDALTLARVVREENVI